MFCGPEPWLAAAAVTALASCPAGSLNPTQITDGAIAAAVQCGLEHSVGSSAMGWQPSILGPDQAFSPAAGAPPTALNCLNSCGSIDCNPSGKQPSEQHSRNGCSASNAGSGQLKQALQQGHCNAECAAGEVHSGNTSRQIAVPSCHIVAMAAAEPTYRTRQQLQQQQQQQQQGTDGFALQQQQAAPALTAALDSSHAAHSQPNALYGNYSTTAVGHPHHHSDCSAAAAASLHSSCSHQQCHLAVHSVDGQQHRQAARLPPRPVAAATSSHQQQQQQRCTLLADTGHNASVLTYRHAAHMTQHHAQHSQLTCSDGRASTVSMFAAAAANPPPGAAASAAGGQAVGRWCGPVAVIHMPALAEGWSLQSDANSAVVLECDEDLFSMGTGDGGCHFQPKDSSTAAVAAAAASHGAGALEQQLLQQLLHRQHVELVQAEVDEQLGSLIEESGSTKNNSSCPSDDMDDDQVGCGLLGVRWPAHVQHLACVCCS